MYGFTTQGKFTVRTGSFKRLLDQFMPQQLIAVFACPVLTLVMTLLLRFFGALGFAAAGLSGVVLTLLVLLSGPAFGYFLSPLSPRGPELARWAWIAPTAVLILVLVSDARVLGIEEAALSYFDLFGPEGAGIGILFVTLPAWSAITYSIGAAIYYKRKRHLSQ